MTHGQKRCVSWNNVGCKYVKSPLPVSRVPLKDVKSIALLRDQHAVQLGLVDASIVTLQIPKEKNAMQVHAEIMSVIEQQSGLRNTRLADENVLTAHQNMVSEGNKSREIEGKRISRIQRIQFERQIGSGTFSKVFLAKALCPSHENFSSTEKESIFAIKVHGIPFVIDNNHISKILNELQILKKLNGKNQFIVKCFKSYKTNCTLNLVLDYHPGQDLCVMFRGSKSKK